MNSSPHGSPANRPAVVKPKRLAHGMRWLLAGLLMLLGLASVLYTKAEHIRLGAEAYIYGYPLVIVDATRVHAAQTLGPGNQLHRVRQFPDAGFKGVVRPNVDTLYTSAFIDMAAGPWVFEMAANQLRYEVMPFMDAWTNVFAAPGSRVNGGHGGRFLLVGPDWSGETPPGLTLMRAPTRVVWLIGRTQTNGVADYPLVHRLQDGVTLRKWVDWREGKPEQAMAWQPASQRPLAPVAQMKAMDAGEFFNRLAMLMLDNPPSAADAPMLAKLARIGLAPGKPPDWSLLERWAVGWGRWIADWRVAKELKQPRDRVRGWLTPPAMLGSYGAHYNIRAVVAMIGLGANLPADAMYPSADVDASGERLNGDQRYRLHFKPGELPPVHAFWSVTAYGADDFLIDNPIKRHALGDRDPLRFNPDGSLDLLIQASAPEDAMKGNWLPVRAGENFVLNARLYWPKSNALDASWGMPALQRVD